MQQIVWKQIYITSIQITGNKVHKNLPMYKTDIEQFNLLILLCRSKASINAIRELRNRGYYVFGIAATILTQTLQSNVFCH